MMEGDNERPHLQGAFWLLLIVLLSGAITIWLANSLFEWSGWKEGVADMLQQLLRTEPYQDGQI